MSMPLSGVTTVGEPVRPGVTGPAKRPATHALARLTRAVRSNRKAAAGTIMLGIFILVSIFPGVIAKDNPGADIYKPRLGLSTSHLLGTTSFGQDMWAQVVYGTRDVSLRSRDFLEAARVRGERRFYIIVVELIPTMTSLIVASFLTNALYAVLFASSLQFIGLGDPNAQSWGTMLYWAQNEAALQTGQPMWAIAPGFCIAALGAAFALLNYAFDEVGNPALRPVRRNRGKRAR
jgi:ABC-type dipeptide/oligopeptide/nickel transport system permease subunit